jgi:hypothetical protein
MPSSLHEALIEIFRNRPSLAAELLSDAFDLRVPRYERIRLESGEFADVAPTQYRADVVVVLADGETPVLAVVVEVQLGRDPGKRWSWPVYLTTLRARLRCPAVLLVVCVDARVAEFCCAPIDVGHPGWTLTPLVLGPDEVPVVTDPAAAGRAPELAVLSAMAHGGRAGREPVLKAFLSVLSAVDEERATLYSDVVLSVLPEAASRYLEAMMRSGTYEYQSDFVRRYVFQGRAEGRAQGRAEGEAKAVLEVLDARGMDVPEDVRARVVGCTDLEQLKSWLRRAATAHSIDEVFA